jgi:hypothetical protein
MTQVILVPLNPLDIRPEDLEPLAEDIRRDDLTVDVRVREQRGYGVTYWEVLEIIIYREILVRTYDIALDKAVTAAIDKIIKKVKVWYKRRRKQKNNKRPLSLTLREEEGGELRHVEMLAPEDEKGVKREKSRRSATGPSKGLQKKPADKSRSSGTGTSKKASQKKREEKKERKKR